MGKVRVRDSHSNGLARDTGGVQQAKPLNLCGVVVSRAAMVEALRLYVPDLHDVQVTEDGDHFWLMIGSAKGGEREDSPAG